MVVKNLRILLVEDDEDDAFIIHDLFNQIDFEINHTIKHVDNHDDALTALEEEYFDVCLFDYRLGGRDGLELLKSVRQRGINHPIIFLTGQGDPEVAVAAMKNGATDYRTKHNLTPESMMRSIQVAIQLCNAEDRRKRAEEKLRYSHQELMSAHQELQESMGKLQTAQDQIIRSEKLASIGRLSAGVCHEVLNPLNIISGHVQALMLERPEDQPLNEDLVSIKEEIVRIEKIVSSLLRFSRKGDMDFNEVDLNEELESVLLIVEKDMNLGNIRVEKFFMDNPPKVYVDANRMRQVFLNLLNNARQAMDLGGVLTVKTDEIIKEVKQNRRREDASLDPKTIPVQQESYFRIQIQDTGTGIKPSDLGKIFDPFFTTKPEDQGTGLGLSVCHSIIEKHNGVIEVESVVGRGTTFSITLPGTNPNPNEKEKKRPSIVQSLPG